MNQEKESAFSDFNHHLNPYPVTIFCPENVFCFLRQLHIYIQMHIRQDFTMEANKMNPNQTAEKIRNITKVLNNLSYSIWVQTVCKAYLRKTKVYIRRRKADFADVSVCMV